MALSSVCLLGLPPELPPLLGCHPSWAVQAAGSLTLNTALPMETCLNSCQPRHPSWAQEILLQGQTCAGSVWGRNAEPTDLSHISFRWGIKSGWCFKRLFSITGGFSAKAPPALGVLSTHPSTALPCPVAKTLL